MSTVVPWTFKTWLANFDGVDLPIGDLARDVIGDADFPDTEDYNTLHRYLSRKGACVVDAFIPVWKFYEASR